MRRRNVVTGSVLAVLLALGTWGALATAQAPGAGESAELAGDGRVAGAGMGPGGGMGMGHGRGMGMGRGRGRGMGMGRGRGMGRGPGLLAHLDELGLSAQQKQRIEAIHDAQRRAAIETRKDLEIAELDMRKLMRDDSPDRGAIEAQIDRIASLQARLHKSRVGTLLDARELLTPQQRQKLEQLRERGPGDDDRPGPGRPGGRRGGA